MGAKRALSRPSLGPSWAIFDPLCPFLGGPGGHLEADLGLGRLDLGVPGGPKLRCQKPLQSNVKSMFLAEFRKQKAFKKLAKWLLGGLVVSLKARREQLGCHLGFKMGLEGPSRAQDGQRWPQERARKVTTLNGKIQDVGSGPPRGSKIFDPKV